jgi:hypothetical protein
MISAGNFKIIKFQVSLAKLLSNTPIGGLPQAQDTTFDFESCRKLSRISKNRTKIGENDPKSVQKAPKLCYFYPKAA